jgi:hypothetical protein
MGGVAVMLAQVVGDSFAHQGFKNIGKNAPCQLGSPHTWINAGFFPAKTRETLN